jgi:formylglycine-generating enzyme
MRHPGPKRASAAAALLLFGIAVAFGEPAIARQQAGSGCPPEMVAVKGYCVDRWEASFVDDTSGQALSPYYPPEPRLLAHVQAYWEIARHEFGDAAARRMPLPELPAIQRTGKYEPRAVSRAGAVPQSYLSYPLARKACEKAGKRLCTKDEWIAACRGERQSKAPYGPGYVLGKCNIFRPLHPAHVLHGNASLGHRDPRLNLVVEAGKDPLLRTTGATPTCASPWQSDRIFDMVGNLDEWIEDDSGIFVGGFYARSTTKTCDAEISGHTPQYYDYSTGTRCCRDPSAAGR